MITLTILDHVSCHIDGLPRDAVEYLTEKVSWIKKGAFMEASFKAKLWDGRVSLFDEDGFTFVYLLDSIIGHLEDFGVDLSEFEVVDERAESLLPETFPEIDEDFLLEETGMKLRDHQITGANLALKNRKGLLDASTSYGKTLLCLILSKALDPYIRTVVVVPTELLLMQTFADYEKSNLSVAKIDKKVSTKKRADVIEKHRHIIVTRALFYNMSPILEQYTYALLLDEAHEFGDVMEEKLRMSYGHWPFRIGMSGTLPKKDKLKLMKIKSCIGGDVLDTVKQRTLMDKGTASKVNIYMIKTVDEVLQEFERDNEDHYDYSVEDEYTLTNIHRINALAAYIQSLPVKNTLILARAELAKKLGAVLNVPVITQEVEVTDRNEYLKEYDDIEGGATVIGTFRTASTGISKNNIHRVIGTDLGISESVAIQGIGRGMRLDGVYDQFDFLDIYAEQKYGVKHAKSRMKRYKDEGHPVVKNHATIVVEQEDF